MISRFLKNRIFAGVFIGILVAIVLTIPILLNVFSSLNDHFADSLYTRNEPSSEIVIITVDNKSTSPSPVGLGRFSQWSRENFIKLLDVLKKENPKVIAFDFLFSNPTSSISVQKLLELEYNLEEKSDTVKLKIYDDFLNANKSSLKNPVDEDLAKAFKSFDNIILAASLQPDGESLIKPLAKFALKAKLGIINAYLEEKGILRSKIPSFKISSENKIYDDLALTTVKKYLGKDEIELPLQNGELLVNFFGDPFAYKMVSFVDVLNGNFESYFFKNKIVLVGPTAKEIHDEFFTPRSNKTPMPGVEFHANEIQTIIEGKFLVKQSHLSEVLTVFILACLLAISLNYLGLVLSVLVSFFAVFTYILLAHVLYSQGLIINMVYPFAAIILAYLGSWVYKYFIADRGKREIKSAFGHYLSPELVDQIAKNPELVKLGGEKKVVTVFFSDIKDSTSYSEKIEVQSWVSQVNEYFTVMEFILKSYGGTLDKYEGDAIMGFFNAPISQEDHVLRAYLSALAMRKALQKLHEKWQQENKPLIDFRIGINTGEALVGNFGSQTRFDYTVMGDTVNTASRLEGSANKTYGTKIIVAGFDEFLSSEHKGKVVLRELDSVLLTGKKEPVEVFELVCFNQELTQEKKSILEIYSKGLSLFRAKDFEQAVAEFKKIAEQDPPAAFMLKRCESKETVFKILNK